MKKEMVFFCFPMRPIMMRYRANNIMFNKQTTALASAAKIARISIATSFDFFQCREDKEDEKINNKRFFWLYFCFCFSFVLCFIFFSLSLTLCAIQYKFLYGFVFIVARKQKYTIYMMILCGPTESNEYKFRKYDYHTWLLYSNDSFLIFPVLSPSLVLCAAI